MGGGGPLSTLYGAFEIANLSTFFRKNANICVYKDFEGGSMTSAGTNFLKKNSF